MRPPIKTKGRAWVIATGFTKEDHKASGKSPISWADIPEGFTEADIIWLKNYMEHPAARDYHATVERPRKRYMIDAESGVDKSASHANKRIEAERVLFDGEENLERLPYIAAEIAERDDDCTALEVATEIWDEVVKNAKPEAKRVNDKRKLN